MLPVSRVMEGGTLCSEVGLLNVGSDDSVVVVGVYGIDGWLILLPLDGGIDNMDTLGIGISLVGGFDGTESTGLVVYSGLVNAGTDVPGT